jgi:hypothetical protein
LAFGGSVYAVYREMEPVALQTRANRCYSSMYPTWPAGDGLHLGLLVNQCSYPKETVERIAK